jgi:hypothetical protein
MKIQYIVAATAAAFLLSACCSTGREVSVWEHVEEAPGPLVVVYYPDHETWNTGFLSALIHLDGEPIARLCEGDFLAIPVAPGRHVLMTSRDDESFCNKAFLRPKEGWPPVEIEVADAPVVLRYGAEPYDGPSTEASICHRHLTAVDEETARREAHRMDLIE